MQEACYCGRTGEIADREPVATDGRWRTGASVPTVRPHIDRLDWLPENTRKLIVREAERKHPTAA